MVNLVSPLSLSQIQLFHGLWAYEDEPRLNRQARQWLLDRRDRQSGLRWVWACNGQIPKNAIRAGESGKHKLYIGRAHHQGSVSPGKVDPIRQACFIPWGGTEHEKKIYEVLCTAGQFVNVTADKTEALLTASSAGVSEDGEPLFIGRVYHEHNLIYGKVQRSHGVCYIAHEGTEAAYKEYQVFVADPQRPFDGHYWVQNEDEKIPPNTNVGGLSGTDQLYIGRALHRGSCTPGMVDPKTRQCHIAWGNDEHRKTKFEYLCNCRGRFVSTQENIIPVGAVRGGYSEFGEPLFIGRVHVGKKYIVGKVQPSHSVCYIPYQSKEVAHKKYDILVLTQN